MTFRLQTLRIVLTMQSIRSRGLSHTYCFLRILCITMPSFQSSPGCLFSLDLYLALPNHTTCSCDAALPQKTSSHCRNPTRYVWMPYQTNIQLTFNNSRCHLSRHHPPLLVNQDGETFCKLSDAQRLSLSSRVRVDSTISHNEKDILVHNCRSTRRRKPSSF